MANSAWIYIALCLLSLHLSLWSKVAFLSRESLSSSVRRELARGQYASSPTFLHARVAIAPVIAVDASSSG